jgi:hypothetical protein
MVVLDLERATAICSDLVVAMDSDRYAVKVVVIDSDQMMATDSDVAVARDWDRQRRPSQIGRQHSTRLRSNSI